METMQGHIDITRQLFISQLQDEVSQFKLKLDIDSNKITSENDSWKHSVYSRIIKRKQQLIVRLS